MSVRKAVVTLFISSLIASGFTATVPIISSPSASATTAEKPVEDTIERPDQEPLPTQVTLESVPGESEDTVVLKAVTNADVAPVNDHIEIFDTTSGEVVQRCEEGVECAAEVPSDNKTYSARTAQTESSSVSSASIAASPTLTMTADKYTASIGEQVNLHALADKTYSGMYIYIFETSPHLDNPRFLLQCSISYSTSCDTYSHNNAELKDRTYTAYLANYRYVQGNSLVPDELENVRAISNVVLVNKIPWFVTLKSNKNVVSTNPEDNLYLTVETNQYDQRSPFRTYIFNKTENTLLNTFYAGRYESDEAFSSIVMRPYNEYIAYVASNRLGDPRRIEDLHDVQAVSNPVRVNALPWSVKLIHTAEKYDYHTLSVTTNQSALRNGYTVAIIDADTGRIIQHCKSGTECNPISAYSYTNNSSDQQYPPVSRFKAVVGRHNLGDDSPAGYNIVGYMENIQASSAITGNVTTVPSTAIGLKSPSATTGGSNPSQNCAQRCHADPINSITGEFWESTTDITGGGLGAGLNFVRNYAVSSSSVDGPMGYGWSHNYMMSLASGQQGVALSDSSSVIVSQENGSLLTFTKTDSGAYVTDAATMATLKKTTNGFVLTRQKKQQFIFDNAGKLVQLSDLHGNNTNLVYSNNRLTTISDQHGRYLDISYNAAGLISGITNQEGHEVSYTYDADRHLISVIDIRGFARSYTYVSGTHLVETMTNPLGGVTTNTYDSDKRVLTQTAPMGGVTRFQYEDNHTIITDPKGIRKAEYFDNRGRVVAEKEGLGTPEESSTSFEYNEMNQPISISDPLGRQTTLTYDVFGNVLTSTDAAGNTTTLTYDGLNNPTTVTDALGNTTEMVYDAVGNLISTTTPEGRKTTQTYNADGTLATSVSAPGNVTGASASDYTTTYAYTSDKRLKSVTSPLGDTVTMQSDSLGRTTSSTDARGKTSSVTRDSAGLPLTTTDASGAVIQQTYDAAGNLLVTTDALGQKSSLTYDKESRLVSSKDALNRVTSYAYDANGDVVTVTGPNGKATTTTRDALGRVTEVKDSLNRITKQTWNAGSEVVNTTDAMGNVTQYTYDALGQVVQVIDPMNRRTQALYDALGRNTSVIPPGRPAERMTYDKDGLKTTQIRSDGTVLANTYDAAGQVTSKVDATGISSDLEYDRNGRLVTSTDRNGRVTAYAYDASGNLSTKVAPGNNVVNYGYDDRDLMTTVDYTGTSSDRTFTYDALGRLTSEMAAGEETVLSYDAVSNLLRRGPPGTTSGGVSYAYDAMDNIASMTYPSGRVVNYDYNSEQENTGVNSTDIGTINFTRNNNGLLTTAALPNAVSETWAYNKNNEPSQMRVSKGSSVLYNKNYTYNTSTGFITNYTFSGQSTSSTSVGMGYDRLGQLSSFGSGTTGTTTFDSRGNLTLFQDNNMSYDNSGQLLSSTKSGATTTYGYDQRGNRVSKVAGSQTTSYEYSPADELLSVSAANAPPVEYTYDANGLRISRQQGTAAVTAQVWDTNRSVPTLLDDGTHEYIYAADSYVPLAQVKKNNQSVTYLHSDHIGSIITGTKNDGSGAGVWSYDAYGNSAQDSARRAVTAFGFAGQHQDPVTGLYDLRARSYDPATGSFLQRDPLELMTDEPYAYATGNPLSLVDPLGLFSAPTILDGAGAFTLNGAQKLSRAGGVLDAWTFGQGTERIENALGVPGALSVCSGQYAFGSVTGSIVAPGIPAKAIGIIARGSAIAIVQAPLAGKKIAHWYKVLHANENGHIVVPNKDDFLTVVHNLIQSSNKYFRPGPYAQKSIPARSSSQKFEPQEYEEITAIGKQYGCHTCGTKIPNTNGRFTPDHQPVSKLNILDLPQQLYPHCTNCSRKQGGNVTAMRAKIKKIINML